MNRSIESLKKIFLTANRILPGAFVSPEAKERVNRCSDALREFHYRCALDLFLEDNPANLFRIAEKLQQDSGGEFVPFVSLLKKLRDEESMFEDLSLPDYAETYQRILALAKKINTVLPKYVEILETIASDKKYAVYQEGTENHLFMNAYAEKPASDSDQVFFSQYKKILPEDARVSFELLFGDGIFEKILSVFQTQNEKLSNLKTLCLFVYSGFYAYLNLSNRDESIFLYYIELCAEFLRKTGKIQFNPVLRSAPFGSSDFSQRLSLLFQNEIFSSIPEFLSLLKDYSLNDAETVSFCQSVQSILDGKTASISFTPAVQKIDTLLTRYSGNFILRQDGKLLRYILDAAAKNGAVNLEEASETLVLAFLPVFAKTWFLTVRKEEKLKACEHALENWKHQIGRYYGILASLLRGGIFQILLEEDWRDVSARDAAVRIADLRYAREAARPKRRERLLAMIEALCSLVVKEWKFRFDTEDQVMAPDGRKGTIIQITKGQKSGSFRYHIRWQDGGIAVLFSSASLTRCAV